MPFRDGTGPLGQGSGRGRRTGSGRGRGRMEGSNPGAGPGGYCVCPNCETKIAHQPGQPCFSIKCPNCGVQMVRD